MALSSGVFSLILAAPSARGGELDISRGSLGGFLGLPTDTRGVVLGCGSLALVLYGLAIVLSGSLVGGAYLAAGVASYLFLHGRLLPTIVWLLVALAGVSVITDNPAGYVEIVAGLALAGVAVWPTSRAADVRVAKPPTEAEDGQAGPLVAHLMGTPAVSQVHSPAVLGVTSGGIRIETIGRFRVTAGGEDLTASLTRKSALLFGWTFLLVRTLADHGSIAREDYGDELAPGLTASTQKARARRQLWGLANRLPAQLAATIKTDSRRVSFDLDACRVDLLELRAMAGMVAEAQGVLDDDLAREAQAFLASLSPGPFLPDIDNLIKAVNQGRGTARDNVLDLRREVAGLRADIACALADRRLASGDFAGTVRLLEPLIKQSRREDLIERLTTAYVRTGQSSRANELRQPVGAAEEG